MAVHSPFVPHFGTNQILTAGASALFATIVKVDKSVRVVNSGAQAAYFAIYDSTAQTYVASTKDVFLAAGQSIIVTSSMTQDSISYISASGTTLQVMTGEGGFS